MAQKNNIRSIRFSDEIADLIDRQSGETFTQKFENLVTRCAWELPQREEQIRQLDGEIQRKREQLKEVQKKYEALERIAKNISEDLQLVEIAISQTYKGIT